MSVSSKGLALTKGFEGLRLEAYLPSKSYYSSTLMKINLAQQGLLAFTLLQTSNAL